MESNNETNPKMMTHGLSNSLSISKLYFLLNRPFSCFEPHSIRGTTSLSGVIRDPKYKHSLKTLTVLSPKHILLMVTNSSDVSDFNHILCLAFADLHSSVLFPALTTLEPCFCVCLLNIMKFIFLLVAVL
jgi:hypothetical protein